MAVKFGVAMGAHVTIISTTESKRDAATKLGAHAFIVSKDEEQIKTVRNTFDFILDTVSSPHDISSFLQLLKYKGVFCLYV